MLIALLCAAVLIIGVQAFTHRKLQHEHLLVRRDFEEELRVKKDLDEANRRNTRLMNENLLLRVMSIEAGMLKLKRTFSIRPAEEEKMRWCGDGIWPDPARLEEALQVSRRVTHELIRFHRLLGYAVPDDGKTEAR